MTQLKSPRQWQGSAGLTFFAGGGVLAAELLVVVLRALAPLRVVFFAGDFVAEATWLSSFDEAAAAGSGVGSATAGGAGCGAGGSIAAAAFGGGSPPPNVTATPMPHRATTAIAAAIPA